MSLTFIEERSRVFAMKGKIIFVVFIVILAVFLSKSALVIDKGTEGQYTGVVAFDAQASSGSDWEKIVTEITGKRTEKFSCHCS